MKKLRRADGSGGMRRATTDQLAEVASNDAPEPQTMMKRRRALADTRIPSQQDQLLEPNAFGYAVLKAQNRSMWSALRAAQRSLLSERELRAALASGKSLEEVTRARNDALEAEIAHLSSQLDDREQGLFGSSLSPQSERPNKALDAALATCAALLAERSTLLGKQTELVRVEIPAPREDKVRSELAAGREAAAASRLAAAEDFWRDRLAQLSATNTDDTEDEDDILGRNKDMQIETLKTIIATLETQIESARKRESETDLQARLLEEIDQTASALEDARSQHRRLTQENAELASQRAVDSAIRSKLESSEFVVAEMKSLLIKKGQQLDDVECEIQQLRAHTGLLEEQVADANDQLRAVSFGKAAAERIRRDFNQALDHATADFSRRLAESEERFQVELKRQVEQANNKPAHKTRPDKIDQVRIKTLEAKIQCSVCLDREKSVVVARCYHAFCKPCIDKVIATRNRKCPACGKPFGANEVHPVFLVN